MHDTLDERLALLGGSLEAAAEVRSPSLARTRGEQIRAAHRRRAVAMTAASAGAVIIGVGSLVAFGPDRGRHDQPVVPGASISTTASAPSTNPSGGPVHAAQGPIAVVDLKQYSMTIYGEDHKVLKIVPVTGGTVGHPSRPGTFTVTGKQDQMTLSSDTGPDAYTVTVHWVVRLDAEGPMLYAAPWADGQFGTMNATHGDIGMSTENAQWLYHHLAVGDRIQIR